MFVEPACHDGILQCRLDWGILRIIKPVLSLKSCRSRLVRCVMLKVLAISGYQPSAVGSSAAPHLELALCFLVCTACVAYRSSITVSCGRIQILMFVFVFVLALLR
jgi:hypothetical protein